MTKQEDGARGRLQAAAIELFREHGYDRTTAAEIAARAGVTERTFFRYFPDKREVLFGNEAKVQAMLVTAAADAPVELGPLDTLFHAFRAFQPMLEENRSFATSRHALIVATPALHERELTKLAVLADALRDALKVRGVDDIRATLAARTAMVAFVHATTCWLDDPGVSFAKRINAAARGLKSLLDPSK